MNAHSEYPESLEFYAEGLAAPQGSKRHVGNGRVIEMSKKLPAWRKAVIEAAKAVAGENFGTIPAPVRVQLHVFLPKPKKSKYAGPYGAPDVDKLQRAVGDALEQAGVIGNDSHIVCWVARKDWSLDRPGAHVLVEHISNEVTPIVA